MATTTVHLQVRARRVGIALAAIRLLALVAPAIGRRRAHQWAARLVRLPIFEYRLGEHGRWVSLMWEP